MIALKSVVYETCVLVAQSCLTLCEPMGCSPTRLPCPWCFPDKITGVSCHSLLQGMFPHLVSKLGLPHCKWIPYHLIYQGNPLYEIEVEEITCLLFEKEKFKEIVI